jgi:putative tryptophan/tyrosine transport system substrate-binding protein
MKRTSLPLHRRAFITLLGGAAAAWPLAARAQQQAAMPMIGYLNAASRDRDPFRVTFHQGLKEVGYVEGHNIGIEYRWAEYQYGRLPDLAVDLVRRQVAVIFATPITAALPAKAATATIPIVFAIGSDPVKVGLVAAFSRPGGNITGVSWLGGPTLAAKRLELLHEVIPTATVVALLVNPNNQAAEAETRETKEAAQSLGLEVRVLNANTERDIDSAFASLVKERLGALLVATDLFLTDRRDQLVALSRRYAVPTVYPRREFFDAGGLMSYGTSLADASRQAGVYTGRILKGEKPTDLPVQQSVKVELFINLKTAKMLGLSVPLPLLGRADEVIE